MLSFVRILPQALVVSAIFILFASDPAGADANAGDIGSIVSVSVSSSGSSGNPAGNNVGSPSNAGSAQGGPSSSDHGSSRGKSTSSSQPPPDCTYELAPAVDQTGGGPPGAASPGKWYLVKCGGIYVDIHQGGAMWIPTGATPGAAPVNPAIDPALVAQQAENSLQLPSPQIETNPSTRAIVNLPTWLWVGQGTWGPESVSASVGTVTATATATPEQVVWTMGDGGSVTCEGPGTAYQPSVPAQSQTTDCSYTYRRSSAGEPTANGDPNSAGFPVRATITWGVSWTAQGEPAGGTLAPLTTSSSTSLPVEQIQSVSTNSQ